MENTTTERTYLVSREIYLQMKQDQKTIAQDRTALRIYNNRLVERRRKYFHSKGMQVPCLCSLHALDPDKDAYGYEPRTWNYNHAHEDWYGYVRKNPIEEPQGSLYLDARSLNIVYGVIRGRKYSEIEPKVREGNEPSKYLIAQVCDHYKIEGFKYE